MIKRTTSEKDKQDLRDQLSRLKSEESAETALTAFGGVHQFKSPEMQSSQGGDGVYDFLKEQQAAARDYYQQKSLDALQSIVKNTDPANAKLPSLFDFARDIASKVGGAASDFLTNTPPSRFSIGVNGGGDSSSGKPSAADIHAKTEKIAEGVDKVVDILGPLGNGGILALVTALQQIVTNTTDDGGSPNDYAE